jgi:ABC-type sugar transport system substrate-binding protein
LAGEKPKVVLAGIATPLGMIDYILDDSNPLNHGVLWDVGNLGYLSVEATVAYLDGKLDLSSDTFASTLGDKQIVTEQVDVNGQTIDAKEILLGAALVFDKNNVQNFNF